MRAWAGADRPFALADDLHLAQLFARPETAAVRHESKSPVRDVTGLRVAQLALGLDRPEAV
jgi:hypothetical protein